jgi:3-hydroxyacyl-CoA dehydrogenase
MLCRKIWEHDGAGCRKEGGACGSGVRGPGIARVMVPGHLLIVIVWEREEKLSSGSKRARRKHVHVDEPLALVLTLAACQALFRSSMDHHQR